MRYDKYNNHIETAKFESYLSKLIIEDRDCYKALYLKIAKSIKRVIDFNKTNKNFDRLLYATFSRLNELYPGNDSIEVFLQNDFNFDAANHFHKVFFETLLAQAKLPKPANLDKKNLTLSELIQLEGNSILGFHKKLNRHIRSSKLFSEMNRGRIECKENIENSIYTTKLGIMTEDSTPVDLKNYYSNSYEYTQNKFIRNPKAAICQKMLAKDLPYISGPSGTISYCFQGMIRLDTYSALELKLYFMVLSASLVARGHHSFYEVQVVAESLGFQITDSDNRKEFYEQFLTKEFKASTKYINFAQSEPIATYFSQYKPHTPSLGS